MPPADRRPRRAARLATALAVLLAVGPATGAGANDPYSYESLRRAPGEPLPTDIGGALWKYSARTACSLYGDTDPRCSKAIEANPQELNGITGASVETAWYTTTGRPDVVIAVHDSGVNWHDATAMRDLAARTWLNAGELPEPDWGTRDPAHPYDRLRDGVVDIKDWCPAYEEERDCGGTGDSRVRGDATDDTDYNANGMVDPEDLIFRFSDGVDADGNGYTDDIAGWDTYEDDNDPYDELRYGHGTGEARDSVAEHNNGGDAGVCPHCRVMHIRVGDSFITNVDNFARGVLYATDNGASVIQSALGTLNNSRFAQEAIDYAYRRGVVLIASAADESAGHHNQPSALEHAVVANSIGEPRTPNELPSYLAFRGCTNYGAYVTVAVPSNSCSSEAVGRSAGMAGLAYAAAKNAARHGAIRDYGELDGPGGVPAGRGLSAEEVDQLVSTTADDLNFVTPVDITRRPDLGHTERYPATEGWDPFFGYGRINADRIVKAVSAGAIPPEADITSPAWFALVDPSRPIEVAGAVAARRAAMYDYSVSWALWSWRDTNAAPTYRTDGVTLARPGNQVVPHSGVLATIDPAVVTAALAAANGAPGDTGPAVDPVTGRGDHENRQLPDKFSVIVRVTVSAKNAGGAPVLTTANQPLRGVGTKQFFVHRDPALFPGYPRDLAGDGAAAPRFADIDNDGADELVVATSNGWIHAWNADGSQVPGWPVHTTPYSIDSDAPAYRSGEITTPYASVLRAPTVGDLDRDGDLEVVVGDFEGRLWAWDRHGQVKPGFPVRTNPVFSAPQPEDRAAGFYDANPALVPGDWPRPGRPLPNDPDFVPDLVHRRDKTNRTAWWLLAAPSLGDIDPSYAGLEIVAGAADRHLYAWHADGTPVPGWPVMLRDPATVGSVDPVSHEVANKAGVAAYNGAKIVTSPAIGDLDGNGTLEVVATVNEQYAEAPNTDDPVFDTVVEAARQADALEPGNNRLYAVHADGARHGGGPGASPHPHANAFLAGFPVKIATAMLELLPVVGNGPAGSPVLGNVDGDTSAAVHDATGALPTPAGPARDAVRGVVPRNTDLEIGVFGTAGPAYVLKKDGTSLYGRDARGRDRTLLMGAVGALTNSPDAPSIPAVGGAVFVRVAGHRLSLAAPAVGLGKLIDVVLPEDQLLSDNHLSVWDLAGTRAQLPAFPREVNDLQFLSTPGAADIDGDGREEIFTGTAYSDLHAFDATGAEPGLRSLAPDGWPKFTGGWSVSPPSVGDFDGDGKRDVAHVVREGRLFVWKGNGATSCAAASWPEFGHDPWMTNNAETDARQPAPATDFVASESGAEATTITLRWTAPGDDGRCGTAATYDVRWSTEPITPATFAAATPLAGAPTPGAPGTAQSMSFPRPAGGRLYFAMRTYDADPATATPARPANGSALSRVVWLERPVAGMLGGHPVP